MQKEYNISLEIYSEDKIQEAITDFTEVAIIKIDGNKIIIEGETDLEIEEIFNEFMNYVIGLSS